MNIDDLKSKVSGARFQGLLWRAVGSSGWIAPAVSKVCNHYGLPLPDPGLEVFLISTFITETIDFVATWYRTNPNNIIKRAMRGINGTNITEETRATVIVAAKSLPEVATVVVRDSANGSIGEMARNPDHPDIVTESQNNSDKKAPT